MHARVLARTHAQARARTQASTCTQARTHTHASTRTHACTQARTRTPTHPHPNASRHAHSRILARDHRVPTPVDPSTPRGPRPLRPQALQAVISSSPALTTDVRLAGNVCSERDPCLFPIVWAPHSPLVSLMTPSDFTSTPAPGDSALQIIRGSCIATFLQHWQTVARSSGLIITFAQLGPIMERVGIRTQGANRKTASICSWLSTPWQRSAFPIGHRCRIPRNCGCFYHDAIRALQGPHVIGLALTHGLWHRGILVHPSQMGIITGVFCVSPDSDHPQAR
jgi:hypothetical protein